MAAALNTEGIARRLRARLDRDPRAGHIAVAVLTLAALLALPLAASNLLDSIGRVRSAATTYSAILVGADNSALALERALGAERVASVAIDGRNLRLARARFEAQAAAALGEVHRVHHPERLPAALREALAQLRPALAASLEALRRRIPDEPRGVPAAAVPPGFGTVDGADDAALAAPRALVAAISAAADTGRRDDVRKIERREHAAAVIAALVVGSALLLLAGAVSRLIAGRRRERLQAERLARAVDGMREGVALFAADMTLVLRNGRFAETAGLAPALSAIGTPFDVIAAALADGVPPVLAAVLAADRRETPVEMRRQGRVLEVFRACMPGGGEILTLADVTERVEGEALARRAVKLEALGRLTGGVAHDFNNLLQGLSANLETLGALDIHAAAAGERRERFEASLDLVERGTRLTRQLLSFSRTRGGGATAIDTGSLLRSLEDLLERTTGDRIELQLVLDPGLWPVLADRSGFENAILNLAINARDAMPDGGTISIVGTNHAPSQAGDDGGAVLVCVADSGVGMDAEQLRRATEPFFTTKPEGVGTGLGLAMVSGFATAAGGAFTLESEVGRGTRATLRLPRAAASPDMDVAAAERGAPVRGGGETILLVEDDHAVRRAVRSGLQAIGYRVVEAASIDGACRLLENDVRPDLVLSDVMLPGTLGPLALLDTARRISPAMPVVFNTGDPEAQGARTLPLDERTAMLVKPWRLDELARVMRTLLDPARKARALPWTRQGTVVPWNPDR